MGLCHARFARGSSAVSPRAYFRNFTVLEEQNYVITFSLVRVMGSCTYGIYDPGSFARGIQESWASESGIQLKIEYGIQVPLTKSLDSSSWIRNPWRGIQNPKLSWISFHGAI